MSFQQTVNTDLGFGVIGEIAFDGPTRALSARVVSGDAANNVVGRAFFYTDDSDGDIVEAGGAALTFAGILANPKTYALNGTAAGGPLAASLALPNNAQGELLFMGEIIVALPAAANIGDVVYSTDATGVLTTTAPGAAAPAASTLVPNATVSRYAIGAAGLAVIKLTN